MAQFFAHLSVIIKMVHRTAARHAILSATPHPDTLQDGGITDSFSLLTSQLCA